MVKEVIESEVDADDAEWMYGTAGVHNLWGTLESALSNAEDAKKEWLLAALEEGQEIWRRTSWMIIPGNLSCGFLKACIVSFPNNPNGKGSAWTSIAYIFYQEMTQYIRRGREITI